MLRSTAVGYGLFFWSGWTALTTQVLWARALRAMLGGSHRSEALVVGVFFAAIPIGAWWVARWLRRSPSSRALWRAYALTELVSSLAIAMAVLLLGREQWQSATLGYLLLACLGIPGAALGAIWPLMVTLLGARGAAVSKLYAVHTLGSALGALGASLLMAELLGTRRGLLLAAAVGVLLSCLGLLLSRRATQQRSDAESHAPPAPQYAHGFQAPIALITTIGVASGFLTVAFEWLGTRLLALRVTTTAYSLGLTLCVQLLGMAIGAQLASRFYSRGLPALRFALLAATLGVCWAPLLAGIRAPLGGEHTFFDAARVATLEAATLIGPGAIALGALFPLCCSLLSERAASPGVALARLAALNGLAGLGGALVMSEILLPTFGLGYSLLSSALLTLLPWLYLTFKTHGAGLELAAVTPLLAAGFVQGANFRVTHVEAGEHIVAEVEGPAGVAAVIEGEGGLRRMLVNGRHTLGDNLSRTVARRFAQLPGLLASDPKRMLLVGLGTGITRGAAEEVASANGASLDVAELMPEVAALTRHFEPWQARFGKRSQLHVSDGRQVLRDSHEPFDLVISELTTDN